MSSPRRFNMSRLDALVGARDAMHMRRARLSWRQFLGAVAVFVQSVLGAGLLAFPAAYKSAGPVLTCVLQAVLLVLVVGGLRMIARTACMCEAETYEQMLRRTAGPYAASACELVLILLVFGASVAYLDVVTDQIQSLLDSLGVLDSIESSGGGGALFAALRVVCSRAGLTAIAAVIGLCICMIPNISGLSLPSIMSMTSMIYVAIVVVVNYCTAPLREGDAPVDEGGLPLAASNVRWAMVALPVLCFGFQGHIAAVPLLRDLQRTAEKNEEEMIALVQGATSPAEAAVLLKIEAERQRRSLSGFCAALCTRFGSVPAPADSARRGKKPPMLSEPLLSPVRGKSTGIMSGSGGDGTNGKFTSLYVATTDKEAATTSSLSEQDGDSAGVATTPRLVRQRSLIGTPIARDGGDETHVPLSTLVTLDRNAIAAVRAFDGVVITGLIICVVIYNATGLFGALAFGMHTESDILLNFANVTLLGPHKTTGNTKDIKMGLSQYASVLWAVAVARIAVAMSVLVTYAILHFCARSVVLSLLSRIAKTVVAKTASNGNGLNSVEKGERIAAHVANGWLAYTIVTVLWTLAALGVAVSVPSVGVVIQYTGNLATFFMFIFPGICLVQITNARATAEEVQASEEAEEEVAMVLMMGAEESSGSSPPSQTGDEDEGALRCGSKIHAVHSTIGFSYIAIGFVLLLVGVVITTLDLFDCRQHAGMKSQAARLYYNERCV